MRIIILYAVLLIGAAGLFLVIDACGQNLAVPPTANVPTTTASAAEPAAIVHVLLTLTAVVALGALTARVLTLALETTDGLPARLLRRATLALVVLCVAGAVGLWTRAIPLAVALLGFRVPAAYLTVDRWGADALWWSFTVSAILGMLMSVGYYLSGHWKSAQMMAPRPA